VKLGRGGIREVEFFVQTQQLIFGGRRPQLRGARTLDMLAELKADGWVTQDAVDDLTEAYLYLRRVEHRLQMVADEQTQRLPAEPDALARFAKFLGHARVSTFEKQLTRIMRKVEQHYARLFEHAPGLDSSIGSLVFTGVTDDPETLETLKRMGFQNPAVAAELVRGWHFGRRAAVQTSRAREVLTELVPALLESFAGSGDPDAALAAFDAALTRMPGASELFSILQSNAKLRELFGDIFGGAPRLARTIVMRPHVLDAAIDPAVLDAAGREDAYEVRAGRLLRAATRTEEFLDGARDMAQEEMFLIGLRTLSGLIDPIDAGRAYSALAAAILRATLAHVETAFATEYGRVPSGRCVIVGMGKLGSREMTASSDLDLILIYDFDEEQPESDGARPLHAVQYYTRLTQRVVSALTVATRRGRLYDVDMRLRPSGGKGPVATQMRSFRAYQAEEAETWEHMALTRARVVGGDDSLRGDVEHAIRAILTKPRDEAALKRDVYDMRRLIAREKGESDPWDLKLAAGGIIDIEFIAQYLALRHGHAHPALVDVDPDVVLREAEAAGVLSPDRAETLRAAHHLFATVTQMVRLSIEGAFDPKQVAAGVLRRIAAAAQVPDFPRLARQLDETRREVRRIFDALLKR
jgi:glutamate-ammonia-ligase adenylyltransferase